MKEIEREKSKEALMKEEDRRETEVDKINIRTCERGRRRMEIQEGSNNKRERKENRGKNAI